MLNYGKYNCFNIETNLFHCLTCKKTKSFTFFSTLFEDLFKSSDLVIDSVDDDDGKT